MSLLQKTLLEIKVVRNHFPHSTFSATDEVAGTTVHLEKIRDIFFVMEERENLFSLKSSCGVFIWNCCRLSVYQKILNAHGVSFVCVAPKKSGFLKYFAKKIACEVKNYLALRYLIMKCPEYIFITAQRTRNGNNLVDNISDHLIDECASNSVAIELLNRNSVSYLRMLLGIDTRIPPVSFMSRANATELEYAKKKISKAISDHFGLHIDVTDLLSNALAQYKANFKFFSFLYSKIRPKAIIGVNNDTLNGLYYSAKIYDIPTVELQHGASNEHTLLWSYPKSIDRNHIGLSIPTAYFTFSDYWTSNTNYPVRVIRAVGNDNLYQDFIAPKFKAVLFISAHMYYDALVSLAKELSDVLNYKIYYKLHPHEYYRQNETIATFGRFENIEVVSDNIEFKELYELCSHVVVVHSTTAYQALQAGKSVCIYKYSNYFWHSDIFNYVDLFDNHSELAELINENLTNHTKTKDSKCVPLFYNRFNAGAFRTAVNELEDSQ